MHHAFTLCLRLSTLQEHQQLVVSTYLEKETARQAALAKRRRNEARSAWYQLLQVRGMCHVPFAQALVPLTRHHAIL